MKVIEACCMFNKQAYLFAWNLGEANEWTWSKL